MCYHAAVTTQIDAFKPNIPIITGLRNSGMRDRHWFDLSQEIGFSLKPDDRFTLTNVLELDLHHHLEAIKRVCPCACRRDCVVVVDKGSLWRVTALSPLINALVPRRRSESVRPRSTISSSSWTRWLWSGTPSPSTLSRIGACDRMACAAVA